MDNKLLFVEKIELDETPHGLNIYDLWTILLSGFWVDRIGIWGELWDLRWTGISVCDAECVCHCLV